MNKGVFIVGTDTEVGKTVVTAGLLHVLLQEGIRACSFKAVQSGGTWDKGHLIDGDTTWIKKVCQIDEDYCLMNPYPLQPEVSPHLAARLEGKIIKRENILNAFAKLQQKYDYISIDLDFRKAMIAMDITKLGFADSCFDAIVCNHVLEHIVDDTKALNELYRVLKTGGWAVVQVPIFGKITQEDFSVSDPEERKRLYGQHDHVRTYGIDFFDRLKNAGFNVFPISKHELLSPEQLEHLSVLCEKEVVFCLKQ